MRFDCNQNEQFKICVLIVIKMNSLQFDIQTHTTIILGHGHEYGIPRGLPISIEKWNHLLVDSKIIMVDYDPQVKPDFLFDLRKNWPLPSSCADLILDTTQLCGSIIWKQPVFWSEIKRVLKPHGIFYGIVRLHSSQFLDCVDPDLVLSGQPNRSKIISFSRKDRSTHMKFD